MKYCHYNNKNKGFTLVELMVSMSIGLVLLGGLMTMYLGSQKSDKTRIALADMDANASVAIKELRKVIQHAGYSTISIKSLEKSFYTESDGELTDTVEKNPLCRDGKKLIVSGLDGKVGLLNPPTALTGYTKDYPGGDILTVIYRPDSPDKGYLFSDCAQGTYSTSTSTEAEDHARLVACSTDTTATASNGMAKPKDSKVFNAYYLHQSSGSDLKQLACFGSRSMDTEPYFIADNIDNIQFRYGVRLDDTAMYKKASEITTDDEWTTVNSVQVALLVGSGNTNVAKNPVARSYDLLGQSITKLESDGRIYKVYSTTIYLHNVGMKKT